MTAKRSLGAALRRLISPEGLERLDRWSDEHQHRFADLFQRASSDLQREVLQRALAGDRVLAELTAFANAIRGMNDEALTDACTMPPGTGGDASFALRLKAEADPLSAFVANGHRLGPWLDGQGADFRVRQQMKPLMHGIPSELLVPPPPPRVPARGRGEAPVAAGRHERPGRAPPSRAPSGESYGRGEIAEDLLNQAGRALGISFTEKVVDLGGPKLEECLGRALEPLKRGIPVPVVFGPAPGKHARYGLVLQIQPAGASRAYQLYDPVVPQTVWVNEGDLVGRAELPFTDRNLKRITAIALPRT